ncbi:Retrovirus-related Pol polyprotein from transposon RE1 [Vitis vinifera]|uniref:Retrovirus-related Pol polyprotein from transposon RE1 n=1 Tax=Vitis vinifera TaxID=29760 RepID=A0A438JJX8_VITVI|nr:Retrovirus-related Pol polyprotein from transposon RE1 [Vitis vinifera]
MLRPDWQATMKTEYVALLTNSTWTLVPKPVNKCIIGCKWIYKLKLKANGSVDRFKAHLVAKGFNQTYVKQLDVNNVFLNGELEEKVHMVQPPGLLIILNPILFVNFTKPLCWQGSSLHLSQTKYIQDLFTRAGLVDFKPIATPMTTSHTLSASNGSLLVDPSQYRSIDTTSFGVSFHSSLNLQLTAYADANWAGCPDDRRSTSAHYIFFGSNLVSWSFSKQKVVSRSSIEVEYRALANAAFELQWIQHFLQEFSISSFSSPILFYNNLSTTFLAPNPIFHS